MALNEIGLFGGIKPNGGGHFVNQYTLLMDVMFPAAGNGQWRALFQTDPFNREGNEADFLVGNASATPNPNGLGAEGIFHGALAPDTPVIVSIKPPKSA